MLLGIVQILPSGAQSHHPLPQHRFHSMLHLAFLPRIVQLPRHRADEIQFSIRFPRQQLPTVAADLANVEVAFGCPLL
jgi:hypothetical protein